MTKLFPHILFRVAGSSLDILDPLEIRRYESLLERLESAEEEHRLTAMELSGVIHDLIPEAGDAKAQNQLLELKRQVFNQRYQKIARFLNTGEAAPAALRKHIQFFLSQSEGLSMLRKQWSDNYTDELARIRRHFRGIITEESFLKGLSFSSDVLLTNLAGFLQRDPKAYRNREADLELSLMKYVSRMAAKTSPFSTFTHICSGFLGTGGPPGAGSWVNAASSFRGEAVRSTIRLNNHIFRSLKVLCENHSGLLAHLPVRLNPTLHVKDGRFFFLGSRYNKETFRRIDRNAVLDWLVDYLSDVDNDRVFPLLAGALAQETDGPIGPAEQYLLQLKQLGLVEFEYSVSGTDTGWDRSFVVWLSGLPNRCTAVDEMIDVLNFMREVADKLTRCPSAERVPLMTEAHVRLSKFYNKMTSAIVAQGRSLPERDMFFPLKAGALFYEDTSKETGIVCREDTLREFTGRLTGLLDRAYIPDKQNDEKRRMTLYFGMKYGPDAVVDLLQFYEDYYRDVRKKEESVEASIYDQKFAELAEVLSVQRKSWQEMLLGELGDVGFEQEVVDISPAMLDRVNARFPAPVIDGQAVSGSAFIQFYTGDGAEPMGVVNGLFPGNGKLFSRFLHLFDGGLTEELRAWNRGDRGDFLHLENTDACYHNSNLHPSLFDHELSGPDSNTNLPARQHVPVSDLSVRQLEGARFISLVQKSTGKRCYLYDLGLLGLDFRSQMFQLLNDFSRQENFNLSSIVSPILHRHYEMGRRFGRLNGFLAFPRIVYDKSIVLKRRTWSIAAGHLPVRDQGESDADYFRKVDRWRKVLRLPDEVFVFVTPDRMKAPDTSRNGDGRDDNYKPQYISFRDPLLVNVWEKAIRKVDTHIRVEEMLPGKKQLLEMDGRPYVSECCVQWHKPLYENSQS